MNFEEAIIELARFQPLTTPTRFAEAIIQEDDIPMPAEVPDIIELAQFQALTTPIPRCVKVSLARRVSTRPVVTEEYKMTTMPVEEQEYVYEDTPQIPQTNLKEDEFNLVQIQSLCTSIDGINKIIPRSWERKRKANRHHQAKTVSMKPRRSRYPKKVLIKPRQSLRDVAKQNYNVNCNPAFEIVKSLVPELVSKKNFQCKISGSYYCNDESSPLPKDVKLQRVYGDEAYYVYQQFLKKNK